MGAEVEHGAHRALGGRIADPASMEDQIPGRLDPPLPWEAPPKVLLDLVRVALAGEPEPAGHPRDVPIDGDRWDAEGVREDDRGGLPADAVERGEALHVARDLAAEPLHDPQRGRLHRPGLLAEEAGRLQVPLEDRHVDAGVIGGGPVLREDDRPGDLVDPLVLGLRREDRRDEELERVRELERRAPVRVGLFEPGKDLPGPRAELRRHLRDVALLRRVLRRRARRRGTHSGPRRRGRERLIHRRADEQRRAEVPGEQGDAYDDAGDPDGPRLHGNAISSPLPSERARSNASVATARSCTALPTLLNTVRSPSLDRPGARPATISPISTSSSAARPWSSPHSASAAARWSTTRRAPRSASSSSSRISVV